MTLAAAVKLIGTNEYLLTIINVKIDYYHLVISVKKRMTSKKNYLLEPITKNLHNVSRT